ncbi:g7253 [Coccomyxa viridis]|uniref:G7253 protein n=1 Tax=Coccomyxa viridis TaxID=1274662 RepID=A0ABP1G418_9CHLO
MEQYLLLAKRAKGRALVDLIQKATAEPGLLAFAELLDVPNVKELETSEHAPAYHLLQLFAYGTLLEYNSRSSSLPPITEEQRLKLRQLTIISIAEEKKSIPYEELMQQLSVANIRELEDLLITDCFHQGLITGRLDQKQKRVEVLDSVGRDVRASQLQPILDALKQWMEGCESVAGTLEERRQWLTQAAEQAEKDRAHAESQVQAAKKSLASENDIRVGSREDMQIDDVEGPSLDAMVEDRIGLGSGRPKRRQKTHAA